jgi:hypothetical protein
MDLNVERELAELNRMSVSKLRRRYDEVFGEATSSRHKQWLVKKIIWRLQALAEGDLSERARQRAAELANDADLRRHAPKTTTVAEATRTQSDKLSTAHDHRVPIPGSLITRVYKGQLLQVKVLPNGFEFEGETFKSLSAVAKRITNSHCNGFHFFQIVKNGGAQ